MVIKTITCHHVYNHGAYLQAYALIKYLKGLGHDAEIINYRPQYLREHFNLWHIEDRYKKIGLGWLYLLVKLPERLIALKRKRVFDQFFHNYIPITEVEYLSIEELQANPPKADYYIAGSDQIWNTTFPNGTDIGFYLDFGAKQTKRISYAASFATDKLADNAKDFVKKKLKYFDNISVRESSGLNILNDLGYNGVEVVDPVFLLSNKWWNDFASNDGAKEDYILIYDFENNPEIRTIAKRLAKLKSLKIYSIGSRKLSYASKNFINYNPKTFVGLIKNATCVISNSFHGSAFALIFNKDFFVINRVDGLNVRMKDLLAKYNLQSRIITTNVIDSDLISSINFTYVNSLLKDNIIKSKKFLNDALNET